jgi:hypothetical protein
MRWGFERFIPSLGKAGDASDIHSHMRGHFEPKVAVLSDAALRVAERIKCRRLARRANPANPRLRFRAAWPLVTSVVLRALERAIVRFPISHCRESLEFSLLLSAI